MRQFLSALRSGFGFLSTIPVGISKEGIENLMKHIYLFPVVGAVIGIILAVIGLTSSLILSPIMLA
ncbi:MAG TPA: adenosylcobinamide-GDP ribazoletransferase, partial [Candidatus Methanoperedens sp.]